MGEAGEVGGGSPWGCSKYDILFQARIACTDPPLGSDGQGLDLSNVILALPTGTTAPATLFQDLKKKFPNLLAVPNFYGLTEFGRTIAYSMDTRILGAVGPGTMVKIVDTQTGEPLGPNQVCSGLNKYYRH